MKARIKFRKYGVLRFIGHLDVMRYFQKAMRRAEIPIAFTGGYSPHMIMSFAQPLGVGVTSDGEYLDIELKEPISSETAVKQLNAVMVEGIDIVSFVQIPEDKKSCGMTIVAAAEYEVDFLKSAKSAYDIVRMEEAFGPDVDCEKAVADFLAQDKITVLKKSKKQVREIDIKPLIYQMKADTETGKFHLFLAAGSEENLKPDLVMDAFFKFMGISAKDCPVHYHRLEVYAKNPDYRKGQDMAEFVSLESLGVPIVDPLQNIDTAIFDIGNVLIHFDWMGYLKSLGFDDETYEHVANAVFLSDDWDKGDSGLYTTEEWLQAFIENDPAYEKEIRRTFEKFGAAIVPYQITEEWLAYFKEKGIKRYYLSNYSEEMYRQSKEQLSFIEDLDGGIFSWKEKCMKPQAEIYKLLLDRYRIDPERAVFFDDKEENIEAAKKAGIKGIVFTTDIPLHMLKK